MSDHIFKLFPSEHCPAGSARPARQARLVHPSRPAHPAPIPDNSHQRHQRRWCKIFQVRGIFSILNATGTPV